MDYTKTVTLTFYRSELLYDIKNAAFVEGDIKTTEDEHDKHQVIDIAEDGNVDRVKRVMNLSFAQCVEACYPYTKEDADDATSLDDTAEETDAYVMHLRVPNDMSKTTLKYLSELIHEYLVCRVLADWMSITKSESQANWEEKAESALSNMRSTLNARCNRIRRTLHPFQ